MSRHARRALGSPEGWVGCLLMMIAPMAGAQTIADYSRAQRAWLESAMSQAAARSAGLAASTPAAAAPTGVGASAPSARRVRATPAPVVQVRGVFASGGVAVAQVMVDATAYLLGVGQGVPGTPWRVETIAVDEVVLGRPGGDATAGAPGTRGTRGARKTFSLPALD